MIMGPEIGQITKDILPPKELAGMYITSSNATLVELSKMSLEEARDSLILLMTSGTHTAITSTEEESERTVSIPATGFFTSILYPEYSRRIKVDAGVDVWDFIANRVHRLIASRLRFLSLDDKKYILEDTFAFVLNDVERSGENINNEGILRIFILRTFSKIFGPLI